MNLKSAWLHFQQLQALPAFRLSPRWQEQVNHNLWWACLPDLITPVIPSRYTIFYVWDRKQQWEEQRLFPCAVLSPSSHEPWNMRIHTFTHTECVYMRDRELENTLGTAACSWSTTVWANGLSLLPLMASYWGSVSKPVILVFFSLELRKPSKSFPCDVPWLPGVQLNTESQDENYLGPLGWSHRRAFPVSRVTHPSLPELIARRKSQPRSKTRSHKVKDITSQIVMLGSCLPSLITIFLST